MQIFDLASLAEGFVVSAPGQVLWVQYRMHARSREDDLYGLYGYVQKKKQSFILHNVRQKGLVCLGYPINYAIPLEPVTLDMSMITILASIPVPDWYYRALEDAKHYSTQQDDQFQFLWNSLEVWLHQDQL